MVGLSPLDVIFVVIVVVAAVRGAYTGFVSELMSFAAVLLGVVGAVLFYDEVATAARGAGFLADGPWADIAAFLLLFVAFYAGVKLLERLIHSFFESLNLRGLDRALGLLLGMAEALVVVAGILILLGWQPFVQTDALMEGSWFHRMLSPLLPEVKKLAIIEKVPHV